VATGVRVIALLALSNVMTNRVLPSWAYVPWSLAVTVAILWVAIRVDRVPLDRLGLTRRWLPRGLGVGALAGAAILVLYLAALAFPVTRQLFEDERVGDVSFWGMAYQVLVRIPFGTVVLEEVAFRGVLLGMLLVRTGVVNALLGSSALFGLWHVLPAIGIEETNPLFRNIFGGTAGPILAVVAAVVGTALGGAVFILFRFLGRHIVTPIILHSATNGLGFLVAWSYLRWS
jgi:uncharacterized protein